MQGPSACLVPGCPVSSNEDDDNSKYNAMPLRMGYAVCMQHFQKYHFLDQDRLTAAVSAGAASTITVYYNFQTTHPVGNEVYELAAVTDRDEVQPFFWQVSTAVQGPYNQVKVGMTLREALSDFLEWLNQLPGHLQWTQGGPSPSQQGSQGNGHPGTPNIILVAHYGACFAHEILVEGLRDHGLLAAASHLRLCDSLITFKALLGKASPCKLPYLAHKHAKSDPPLGCARSHAVALRQVSNAILSSKPFLPDVMWRASDCALPAFAERIGISMPQQSAMHDAAQHDAAKGGLNNAPSEGLGSQSSAGTAIDTPASPSNDAAVKGEAVKVEKCDPDQKAAHQGHSKPQLDTELEPAPKRRAVGTLSPAPERLGPTTPPAIPRTQPRCSTYDIPPSMRSDHGQTSCHAVTVKVEQSSSMISSTPQAAMSDSSLPATQHFWQADGPLQLEATQLAEQAIVRTSDVSCVGGVQPGACCNETATFPPIKVEQPTPALDRGCSRPAP